MSEAFPAAVAKVDFTKYIDQLEGELKKVLGEVGPGKTPQEIEMSQERIQALIRKQSKELAKELGISGNHVLVFMAASTILTAAWLSFTLRSETADLSRSPEDRIALTDMLNSLDLALGNVIAAASNYADLANAANSGNPNSVST